MQPIQARGILAGLQPGIEGEERQVVPSNVAEKYCCDVLEKDSALWRSV